MSSRSTILLVGSGERLYREYLLASIARDHDVWLLDASAPDWQSRYVAGATVLDPFDERALVRAARDVAARRPVAGALSYDEALILPTARIVEELELPGMSVETVRRCRDKLATREAVAAVGIAQPQSVAVASLADAADAAERIGYPVVLKPRGLGASHGVVVAAGAGELPGAWAAATAAEYPGVPTYGTILVEEFLDGPEISIDGFVVDGAYRMLFIARKQLGMDPYFEETGHIVYAGDRLLHDADLSAYLSEVHRALGIERGLTHSEVRLTSRGPKLIEVNGRVGGDLIGLVGREATGIDIGEVAATVATGGRPIAHPTRRRCVGIRFCYPPADCRVVSVALPRPGGHLIAATALAAAGERVRLAPRGYAERVAYVMCTAGDARTCDARLDGAAARVKLSWAPLEPAVAAHAGAGA